MQAIVELNGRQYQVQEGRFLEVDLLGLEANAELAMDKVVLAVKDGQTLVGAPYVAGAKVTGKVMAHRKLKKVLVFKYRRKKGYRVKQGHRHQVTRVMIESIQLPG